MAISTQRRRHHDGSALIAHRKGSRMQVGMIGLARTQPSRGNADFANRVLWAMRYEFGGHAERPAS